MMSDEQRVCMWPNFSHLWHGIGFGKYALTLYRLYNTVIHWGMIGDSNVQNIVRVCANFPSCFRCTRNAFDTYWSASPTWMSSSLHPSTWEEMMTPLVELRFLCFSTKQGMNPGASVWGVSYFGRQFSFRQGAIHPATWKHSSHVLQFDRVPSECKTGPSPSWFFQCR
jgi:hypothetical protein